jgi:hypothetical protein
MLVEKPVGQTVRISAADLKRLKVPVTAGATVTIRVYNPDGSQNGSDYTATSDPDDTDNWFIDLNVPSPAGEYEVKITAIKDGATWKGKAKIRATPF